MNDNNKVLRQFVDGGFFTRVQEAKDEYLKEGIVEGLHGSLDGWTVYEQEVIMKYIMDLVMYAEECK